MKKGILLTTALVLLFTMLFSVSAVAETEKVELTYMSLEYRGCIR